MLEVINAQFATKVIMLADCNSYQVINYLITRGPHHFQHASIFLNRFRPRSSSRLGSRDPRELAHAIPEQLGHRATHARQHRVEGRVEVDVTQQDARRVEHHIGVSHGRGGDGVGAGVGGLGRIIRFQAAIEEADRALAKVADHGARVAERSKVGARLVRHDRLLDKDVVLRRGADGLVRATGRTQQDMAAGKSANGHSCSPANLVYEAFVVLVVAVLGYFGAGLFVDEWGWGLSWQEISNLRLPK